MWVSYAVVTAALALVGFIGGKATEVGPWYRNLNKPSWNPPDWAFGVAWTTIYLFIIASTGHVWNVAESADKPVILAVVGINLVLNTLWSVVFFTWKRPGWALVEVAALWLSIVAMIIVFAGISTYSAWMLAPYLAWVSVASLLNLRIIQLNPDTGAGAGA